MVCHSPFDDDNSDSVIHEIQVPESPERETSGQWLPPSPTFYTRNWTPIEPSQDKRSALQLFTKHWLPSGKPVVLPDGHVTLANLTGRSYVEAFRDPDLDCLRRPRESSPRTPSLAFDDSHSRDSLSCSTPRNINKDLSLSPKLVSQASFESTEHSEYELSLPVHSVEIGSNTKSDNTSASVIPSSTLPDVFQMDVTKSVDAYCSPETCIPPSGTPSKPPSSSQNSESAFSQRGILKLDASITVPPTVTAAEVAESYTEQGDLKDDAYVPEPPTNGFGRRGTKKHSKSLIFECSQCSESFTRNFDRQRHMKTIHATKTAETIIAHTCICGARLSRKDAFKRHVEKIPKSCITMAKRNQKPEPPRLSEETYAICKLQMMEICTRQS